MSPLLLVFWLLLVGASVASARWGGGPERAVAALYLTAAIATVVARPAFELRYSGMETYVFVVDVTLFLGLTLIAVRCGLWWTICASALQCLTVLAHVGKALNPGLLRLGYQIMATWAAFPAVLLLCAGIWSRARRMQSRG